MKICVFEENQHYASALSEILMQFVPNVVSITNCLNPSEMIHNVTNDQFAFLFFGIGLHEPSSINLLEHLSDTRTAVIITSHTEQLAFQALQYQVAGYLLKPYNVQELVRIVKRQMVRDSRNDQAIPGSSTTGMVPDLTMNHSLALNSNDSYEFITASDIVRVEAQGMYANVFLNDGTKRMVTRPLKTLETAIGSNTFARVHNSHLVNIKYISRFMKNDGGYLTLKDGTAVPVSKRRKEDLFMKIRLL